MHLQKVLSIVVFAVLAGTARGEVIIEHMGNNHPEANGWTLSHDRRSRFPSDITIDAVRLAFPARIRNFPAKKKSPFRLRY